MFLSTRLQCVPHWTVTYKQSFFPPCLLFFPQPQMSSRRFTRGCRRTTSSTCPPSNTCGPWTIRFSGGTSSWRPACAFSPDGPTESSSSSSASAKDVTGSLKSGCRRRGQCAFQTQTDEKLHPSSFPPDTLLLLFLYNRDLVSFVKVGRERSRQLFCKLPAAFFSPFFKSSGLVLCRAQCQLIQECRWK